MKTWTLEVSGHGERNFNTSDEVRGILQKEQPLNYRVSKNVLNLASNKYDSFDMTDVFGS
jgi:hypothetical protein